MGQLATLNRVHNQFAGSDAIGQIVYPDLAAAVALTGGKNWAYGAWVQIVAGATVVLDSWLFAAHVTAALADEYQIQIGTGAAAAEVGRAALPFGGNDLSGMPMVYFGTPLHVPAGTRLAGRVANANAGVANTISVKLVALTGV